FIDNAVAVQILKFDVTYPHVVFTDRKAIAIVVSRYRAVLGIFHRLEQAIVQVTPEKPRRFSDRRPLFPVVTRSGIANIPGYRGRDKISTGIYFGQFGAEHGEIGIHPPGKSAAVYIPRLK